MSFVYWCVFYKGFECFRFRLVVVFYVFVIIYWGDCMSSFFSILYFVIFRYNCYFVLIFLKVYRFMIYFFDWFFLLSIVDWLNRLYRLILIVWYFLLVISECFELLMKFKKNWVLLIVYDIFNFDVKNFYLKSMLFFFFLSKI